MASGGCWIKNSLKKYFKAKNVASYEKAKATLRSDIEVKDAKLVGRYGENATLTFNWRFTARFEGADFYIYIDPEKGKEIDIVRVHN